MKACSIDFGIDTCVQRSAVAQVISNLLYEKPRANKCVAQA